MTDEVPSTKERESATHTPEKSFVLGRRKTDHLEFSVSDLEQAVHGLIERRKNKKVETPVETAEVEEDNLPDAEIIEAVGELEDKRLGHWLIRITVYTALACMAIVFATVGYATVTHTDISVPSYVEDTFITIKDVLFAILDIKAE